MGVARDLVDYRWPWPGTWWTTGGRGQGPGGLQVGVVRDLVDYRWAWPGTTTGLQMDFGAGPLDYNRDSFLCFPKPRLLGTGVMMSKNEQADWTIKVTSHM